MQKQVRNVIAAAIVMVLGGCVTQARTRMTTPMGTYDSTRDSTVGSVEARRTLFYAADGRLEREEYEFKLDDAGGNASAVNDSLAEALVAQIEWARSITDRVGSE